ncbi:hypothetical protein FRC04_005921 [Tulasnella sp. 424]|nr:hypothetical protein FRC04_005921 [Tulasnella sp. 424]KAG8976064.1 hypothetical protein FRC05_004696 [Tulasnella sp. 425]
MEDPQLGISNARFIKVVIVGPAGVGKTSLRHQYISGRFAVGYRATIGTDFITKTLPHYSQIKNAKSGTSTVQPSTPHAASSVSASTSSPPELQTTSSTPPLSTPEPTTLQIWDTAGQERFSSLSAAFFRGADAVILVFDVNKPDTLEEIQRWWDQFRTKVPIQEGEEANFCVVVVGNKADLIGGKKGGDKGKEAFVTKKSTQEFLKRLIPVPKPDEEDEDRNPDPDQEPRLPSPPSSNSVVSSSSLSTTRPSNLASTESFGRPEDATPRQDLALRSPGSRFGTMASTRTGFSIYHTPSSSLFTSLTPPSGTDRHANQLTAPYPFTSEPSEMLPLSPRLPGSRAHYAPPDRSKDDDLEMSMDLEYDYNYDLHQASATTTSASESGYATAKSTPSQSPTSAAHPEETRSQRRPRIGSVASNNSLSTIRPSGPTPAIAFRDRVRQRQASGKSALVSPSPSRSRASSMSSSATPNEAQHNIHSDELPTPSASPPSPPVLTASLMATLHQQRQEGETEQEDLKLDLGPKLFFTSAKTGGAGGTVHPSVDVDFEMTPVSEIFAYVAKRVVRRWEWEESQQDLDLMDGSEALATAGKQKSIVVRLGEGWTRMTSGLQGSCCST